MVRIRGNGKPAVGAAYGVGVMQAITTTPPLRCTWESLWVRAVTLMKELSGKRAAKQLRVHETLVIGDKRQLLIVECAGRRLLIGTAGNFVGKLADIDAPITRENDRE